MLFICFSRASYWFYEKTNKKKIELGSVKTAPRKF